MVPLHVTGAEREAIVEPVPQRRLEQGEPLQAAAPQTGGERRARQAIAHQRAVERMARNGGEGAHHAEAQAVIVVQHVQQVLERREPERHRHRVHHPVERLVDLAVAAAGECAAARACSLPR
ncbi:MAG: hypothetical protein U1E76_21495 [Planctomycetota bacterium]